MQSMDLTHSIIWNIMCETLKNNYYGLKCIYSDI